MRFLLDTNIVIHAYENHPLVQQRLVERDGLLDISALTLAELRRGVYRRPRSAEMLRRRRLALLMARIPVLPFDADAADAYDNIIGACGFSRSRDFDRMIAAHALSVGATLVTDNTADFATIPGLALANWATP